MSSSALLCRLGDPAWDLPAPIPADANFGPQCSEYASSRCCSDNYTAVFSSGPGGSANPEALYPGYTYNQCPQLRNISAACVGFLSRQECSFACDPVLGTAYDGVNPIPLCPSMCDAWFAACADDYTCETDWETWPESSPNGLPFGYYCPENSCRTYREVYGNSSGLCTNMWAPVYNVSTSDTAW